MTNVDGSSSKIALGRAPFRREGISLRVTFVAMSLLITADAGETKLQLIGRKAANLLRMRRADLPVPEFAVLTTAAAALALSGESTPTLPSAVTADRPTAAAEIRAAILNLSISDPVMGAIEQALRAVGRGSSVAPVAVRSSSLSEDAAAASFAGQFESFLAVDGLVNVAARIKDIWASCFNERVLSYRAQMAPVPAELALPMAVILQRQIYPAKSGVLFTRHPSGVSDSMYAESNFGTAESVVDGLTIPDSMVIDRTTGTVIDQRVAAKTMMTSVTPGRSGSSTLPIPKDLADASVLTKADAVDLVQLGRRVEQVFGAPQDIEWAIDSDRLWVIQARPITQRVNGSISDAQQL